MPAACADDLTPLPDEADAAATHVEYLVVTEPGADATTGVVDRCHAAHDRHLHRRFWPYEAVTAAVSRLVLKTRAPSHCWLVDDTREVTVIRRAAAYCDS